MAHLPTYVMTECDTRAKLNKKVAHNCDGRNGKKWSALEQIGGRTALINSCERKLQDAIDSAAAGHKCGLELY